MGFAAFGSGLIALWLGVAAIAPDLRTAWSLPVLVSPQSQTDAITQGTVRQYLQGLVTKGYAPSLQGIWVQTQDTLLASNEGTMALPAASLTKVSTSLASLATWPPDHRFETLVGITGPLENGVVKGDLVIQGGGDPFFIWEEAIALGNTLNRLGIRQVTGDLVILDNFAMNYEDDRLKSGELLRQGMNARLWDEEVKLEYQSLPKETLKPQLEIRGKVRLAKSLDQKAAKSGPEAQRRATPILRHQSLPLSQLLKLMNIYSNNAMAEMLAENLGGSQIVAQKAAAAAGFPPQEIRLINGSGLGMENQISPRAVVTMLLAIEARLLAWNQTPNQQPLTIADLFPVAGRDPGTLEDRKLPFHATVKTGTLNEVSALAGVFPTRDRGLVWFAIINRGTDIENLRDRQDLLLQGLVKQWGAATQVPPEITPRTTTERDHIGDESRNIPLPAS